MSVGLYLSRCKGVVGDALDLDALGQSFEEDVSIVRVIDDIFEPESQARIIRDIADAELESVILAGHSLDHYAKSLSGRLFFERLIAEGVNPAHVIFCSLREQVVLPHKQDREGAQRKARALLDVSLLRATMLEAARPVAMAARHAVLIMGATIEGLVAAQRLLQLGYRVVLADRGSGTEELSSREDFGATVAYVMGHPNAEFVDDAHIVDGLGWVGDYEISLASGGDVSTHKVGGMLLAEPAEVSWVEELRRHFRLDVDDEGRARSINPGSHPAETIEPGLMVVPVYSEDDRTMRDKVAAADSAAMALSLRLSQPETVHYVHTSVVDETLCGGCASCVKTCAFKACTLDPEGVSHVDERRCRACGKCVVSCPVGARDIITASHGFMVKAIHELASADVGEPKVLGIVCGGCGNPAMNAAGEQAGPGNAYPSSFLPLWIPCSGRLDALYVLEAFRAGFDGVTIFRCREGHCHNLIGNLDMDRRINLLRTVLRSRNIDDSRLRIVDVRPDEGTTFSNHVNDFFATLEAVANGREVPV